MMTPKSILRTYGGQALASVPENIRRRIESRPRLREDFEAQARVAALLSLKRYETPDPALEGRLSHRVELRIRNRDFPLEDVRDEFLPEWARMVAVVVFMLGLSVFTHREMLSSDSPPPLASDNLLSNSSDFPPFAEGGLPPRYEDPFSTLVSSSPRDLPFFSDSLNQQVRESFDIRPLLETNRHDRLTLLPVRQNLP